MSWLEDLSYEYIFQCMKCDHREKIKAKDRPEKPKHLCGEEMEYLGFEPVKVKQTHAVEYDKNGRKAVAIRGKDGKMQYFSKTKLNYMKTGRVESQYTKEFQEALQKEEQKRVVQEQKAEAARRQKMDGHFKQMVANLPEGEYVSDGVSVKPMKSKV